MIKPSKLLKLSASAAGCSNVFKCGYATDGGRTSLVFTALISVALSGRNSGSIGGEATE
jgi:hypothetical protein